MVVRLRLWRAGRKHLPHFRIVAIDSRRAPRSGAYIESVGSYSPVPHKQTGDKHLRFNSERVLYWLSCGAQPSRTVQRLLAIAGVLPAPPRKHAVPLEQVAAKLGRLPRVDDDLAQQHFVFSDLEQQVVDPSAKPQYIPSLHDRLESISELTKDPPLHEFEEAIDAKYGRDKYPSAPWSFDEVEEGLKAATTAEAGDTERSTHSFLSDDEDEHGSDNEAFAVNTPKKEIGPDDIFALHRLRDDPEEFVREAMQRIGLEREEAESADAQEGGEEAAAAASPRPQSSPSDPKLMAHVFLDSSASSSRMAARPLVNPFLALSFQFSNKADE